jgi:selenoprotein W-related protein
MAQELLAAFEDDVAEVALVPGSGGIFEIALDGEVLATNRDSVPMPDVSSVKRLLRDRVAPGRRIGHE